MLRIGIVGAGAMAEYHAKRFGLIAGSRVTAVCDRLGSRAAAFAGERGLAAFADPDDMAASGLVDAFAVAAYDSWHRQPVLAALDRGLPVFCEKPLARTLQAAAEMAAAARRSGLPALVNFSKRNGGLLSLARALIGEGRIGASVSLTMSYFQSWLLQDAWGPYRTSPRWRWRLSEALSTHGALGDLGSHLFDAALLLAGADLAVTACSGRRFEDSDPPAGEPPWLPEGGGAFESFAAALGSGKARVAASADWRAAGNMDAFAISARGESGYLEMDTERSRDSLVLHEAGGNSRELKSGPCPSTYERFVAVASGSEDPVRGEPIDFERALAVQTLIEDCARLMPVPAPAATPAPPSAQS